MTNEEKAILELRNQKLSEEEEIIYKELLKMFLYYAGYGDIIRRNVNIDDLSVENLESIVKCFSKTDICKINFLFTAGKALEYFMTRKMKYEDMKYLSVIQAHYLALFNSEILNLSDLEQIDRDVLKILNSLGGKDNEI